MFWRVKQCFEFFSVNILLCYVVLAVILWIPEAQSAEIIGSNGKPIPKAATFHFAEYAYKETSKNVGIDFYTQ